MLSDLSEEALALSKAMYEKIEVYLPSIKKLHCRY